MLPPGLGDQGLGRRSVSAFATGSLGVCLPPRTWVACVALGLAAKPVFTVETCAAWSICPRGVPPCSGWQGSSYGPKLCLGLGQLVALGISRFGRSALATSNKAPVPRTEVTE